MEKNTEAIRYTDMLKRMVLDRSSAEKVGIVDEIWLDTKAHRVLGLICKSGLGIRKRLIPWSQIGTIGNDGIMVNFSSEENQVKKPDKNEIVVGHELWTDSGNKVGKVTDFLFMPDTGKLLGYLYSSNDWGGMLDGIYMLEPAAISSIGNKRAIAFESAVQNAQVYTEGIHHKIEQAKDVLQEDYKRAQEQLQAVADAAQGAAQGAVKNLQNAAESATKKIKNKDADEQESPGLEEG